ncbi:MAG: serine hydrolase domain-containing protein [Phycisphaerae bacterium]
MLIAPRPRSAARRGVAAGVAALLAIGALLASAVLPGCGTDGGTTPPDSSAFDLYAQSLIQTFHFPGMAVGLVKNGRLVFSRGYGWADLATSRPASADTVFTLAGTSKLVVGVAGVQLADDGTLGLDTDIASRLLFLPRHPQFLDAPITMRLLLSHTAGLGRNDPSVTPATVGTLAGDPGVALGDYLASCLIAGGSRYAGGVFWTNFLPPRSAFRPGTGFAYSHVGAALAAHAVERWSSTEFEAYCHARIFSPLGMSATSWRVGGYSSAALATPYAFEAGSGFQALPQYTWPEYPALFLRTNVHDLARLMIALLGSGAAGGTRILSAEAVAELERVQNPSLQADMALHGYYDASSGPRLFGHAGRTLGWGSSFFYQRSTGLGAIVLVNAENTEFEGDPAKGPLDDVTQKLFQIASQF